MSQLVTAMGSAAPNARSEALPHMLGNFMKLDNLLFFLVLGPSQAWILLIKELTHCQLQALHFPWLPAWSQQLQPLLAQRQPLQQDSPTEMPRGHPWLVPSYRVVDNHPNHPVHLLPPKLLTSSTQARKFRVNPRYAQTQGCCFSIRKVSWGDGLKKCTLHFLTGIPFAN